MEYVCANFNIRLVTNNAGNSQIINVGDKMLAQPSLSQFHSTEMVSLARAEHNRAYHYGNIGHELVVTRYFGPYADLWSAANNAFTEAAGKDNINQQGTLTIDFSTSTGEVFEIRNAAMSEMNILRGNQYGKGFVVEYRYIFGELDDITTAKLLDNYGTGAEAAYSLRELSTAWAGLAVVEVREEGGDTTQTFTAAELTDGTLATFCGISNGFVSEWKDQSGNANDATQVTLADQPRIYNGRISDNGKYLRYKDGFLYWASGTSGHIGRVAIDANGDISSARGNLVSGLTTPTGIDVTDTYIYWTDAGTDKIQRCDLDGANVTDILTTGILAPTGLSVSSSYIFWADDSATYDSVFRCDLDGTNVTTLYTSAGGGFRDVVANETYVYFADQVADTINRMEHDGTNHTVLVTTGGNMYGMAVTDTYIYTSYYGRAIYRCELDGSNFAAINTELFSAQGMAVTDTHFYVVDNTNPFTIQRGELDGSNVAAVVPGLIYQDSLPAIDFDGLGDRLQMDSSVTGINNIAAVARCDDADYNFLLTQGTTNKGLRTTNTGSFSDPSIASGLNYFQTSGFISLDGISFAGYKTAQTNQIIFAGSGDIGYAHQLEWIGANSSPYYWDGTIQEIILWSTKQQTNPGIIDEMNRYYQLY